MCIYFSTDFLQTFIAKQWLDDFKTYWHYNVSFILQMLILIYTEALNNLEHAHWISLAESYYLK